MSESSRCVALLVAAGSGLRFGGNIPKQYQDLDGLPILRRTVLSFLNHPGVDAVQVVFNPSCQSLYEQAVEGLSLPSPVSGGSSRQESVRLGLEALAKQTPCPTLVMIHDAARPLVNAATIDTIKKTFDTPGVQGVIAAQKVVDTLVRCDKDGSFSAPIDRENVWRAYTPQTFYFDQILEAHRTFAGQEMTDDAAVAAKAGLKVVYIPSNPENIKITNQEDMVFAKRVLRDSMDIRVKYGEDIHTLTEGDHVILGGIKIPHDKKFKAHSDGDVVLHALTDALLAAAKAGDIGKLFPPSDPKWKDCDSRIFLKEAKGILGKTGATIQDVSVTIVCERPKIGPYREQIENHIAELLEIDPNRVSVNAKTAEGCDSIGRGEAIKAIALVTFNLSG